MEAYFAKDRMIAKVEAAAKAKICCPVGSYGYLMDVLEVVKLKSRTECYVAEKAIIEAEKPSKWMDEPVVYAGDYLQFFKVKESVEVNGPADGDWSAYYAMMNID